MAQSKDKELTFEAALDKLEKAVAKLEGGELTLEQALALDPDQLDALYCLGSVSLDEGRPEEALRLYDRVVAATHEPLPRFLAGVAALRAGRADHALVRLRQAARDDPTLVDAHVWEAAAHVALGDDRAAVAALRRAVENGLRDPGAITSRPEFAALRSRPGFTALVSLLKRLHGSEGKPRRTDRRASDRPGRRSPRPTWPRARR